MLRDKGMLVEKKVSDVGLHWPSKLGNTKNY